MGAMYGEKPLVCLEIKGSFWIDNRRLFCVYGKSTEGVCVDVYRDESMKELVSMQHGIMYSGVDGDWDLETKEAKEGLYMLMESMAYEF